MKLTFNNLFEKLSKTIKEQSYTLKYYKDIIKSEEDTKFNLIFPIIYNLGLSFPKDIQFESKVPDGRIDILLKYGDESVIIETKKVSKILNIKDEAQIKRYLTNTSCKLGILTNGDSWIFYTYNNNIFQSIKWIKISNGLYEDDEFFMSHLIKMNFDITYFLNYS